MSGPAPTRAAIEAVWRIEAARLIGGLVRSVRDVDRAEDLAQEALLAALERWPESGIPSNPGAWLMTAAKNRAVDERRRRAMMEAKHQIIEREASTFTEIDESAIDGVGDDVLRLILIACHPILSKDARVVLTLRLVAGLTTAEIARAFLSSEPTIGQRISRAKRTLAEAKVPFEIPDELGDRISSALEVVYLIFNEGYTASSGGSWMRAELCEEASRLARMIAALAPKEAEAHGLLALLELQSSRARARVGADGAPVLLLAQDRSRWDRLAIARGLKALERAESLARPLGPYAIQAAIAACHARARKAEDTDWRRIVALYDGLVELTGSPVVELNRAVAVSMAYGPLEALALVDELVEEPALRDYHLLPSVRGDLLMKLGRVAEAKVELLRAAELTDNAREKAILIARATAEESPSSARAPSRAASPPPRRS